MKRRVTILGSTGSIGRSALEVIRQLPGRFDVVGLAAHNNVELLAEQVAEYRPAYAALTDPEAAKALRDRVGETTVLAGIEGLERLAQIETDVVLCAMVGAVGLRPLLAAIDAGHTVALANKEPLVIAGEVTMRRARARGVQVLPVDSEHNAIFQCLQGHARAEVAGIVLTASGGPFYGLDQAALREVSPEQAAKHPRWDMGVKISVDSATLMNKGLEVVEAMWLFDLPLDKIRVLIHPQSIVHGLVELTDGGLLAHLGPTDMKFPIKFALTWPERVESSMGRLDLARIGALTFAAPDFAEFPCLALALEAARVGGTLPAALNAANETAVAAFCARRIGFLAIPEVVQTIMENHHVTHEASLEAVLAADAAARRDAQQLVATLEAKV